ncbi:MAG: ribbon-helix-helix protein, CopG family [Pleurocapsa sp. MO_226.B13]|nr:ribbon-helix-helix protein, CopG family [Pleurocapsa sp. MO_226.B13]
MNFSVYLNEDLGKKLDAIAQKEQVSRNSLIAEAVSLLLEKRKRQQWSQEILEWQGCPEFNLPGDEDLLLPKEDIL